MTKDEENFEEAVVAVNSCFAGGKPTESLLKILNDQSCSNLTKEVVIHHAVDIMSFENKFYLFPE